MIPFLEQDVHLPIKFLALLTLLGLHCVILLQPPPFLSQYVVIAKLFLNLLSMLISFLMFLEQILDPHLVRLLLHGLVLPEPVQLFLLLLLHVLIHVLLLLFPLTLFLVLLDKGHLHVHPALQLLLSFVLLSLLVPFLLALVMFLRFLPPFHQPLFIKHSRFVQFLFNGVQFAHFPGCIQAFTQSLLLLLMVNLESLEVSGCLALARGIIACSRMGRVQEARNAIPTLLDDPLDLPLLLVLLLLLQALVAETVLGAFLLDPLELVLQVLLDLLQVLRRPLQLLYLLVFKFFLYLLALEFDFEVSEDAIGILLIGSP